MDEIIDKATFNHLVDLAAFEMDPEEADYLRGEMNKQIKIIHEMAAVPIDEDIVLTTHGISYTPEISPAIRTDEWQPSEKAAGILQQVPESREGYIIVPESHHTELE
jgi:aspartyl/glutamyl-tRNA(Asn/Gln) amidotransferase C subunit